MSKAESTIVGIFLGVACVWLSFVTCWWTAAIVYMLVGGHIRQSGHCERPGRVDGRDRSGYSFPPEMDSWILRSKSVVAGSHLRCALRAGGGLFYGITSWDFYLRSPSWGLRGAQTASQPIKR